MTRLHFGVILTLLVALCSPAARGASPLGEVLEAQNLLGEVCAAFEFEGSYAPTLASLDFPLLPDTRWKDPTDTLLPGIPPRLRDVDQKCVTGTGQACCVRAPRVPRR